MNASDTETGKWVRRYAANESAPVRLICFPHAGGSASFFHPVAMKLAAAADVICLQYPGRQDRRLEPAITEIGEYADRLAAVIGTLAPKPTVYFGHSMGAVLAFETAFRLERDGGDAPRSVIASGRRGPATVRTETVHQKDDNGIIAEIKLLNGTNAALLGDEEILRMALPAIRGDYRAIETYSCPADRALRSPITVLTGVDDPKTTADEARAWQQHTTGGFRLETFPGGHFFLAEQQAAVLAEIGTELDRIAPGR